MQPRRKATCRLITPLSDHYNLFALSNIIDSRSVPSLLHSLSSSSCIHHSVCLSEGLPQPALPYLAVKQQVQLLVNPLLDIQPPLQVLAVVFDCQLAKLAVCRLLCLVRRLEHHPGLGAWL